MRMTQPRNTYLCTRPEEEHTLREYLPDVWYPMPPMQFSGRREQDKAEMLCLARTGHQLHALMQDNVGVVIGVYFCCNCGMKIDQRKKSWWQMFLWELRGRR